MDGRLCRLWNAGHLITLLLLPVQFRRFLLVVIQSRHVVVVSFSSSVSNVALPAEHLIVRTGSLRRNEYLLGALCPSGINLEMILSATSTQRLSVDGGGCSRRVGNTDPKLYC